MDSEPINPISEISTYVESLETPPIKGIQETHEVKHENRDRNGASAYVINALSNKKQEPIYIKFETRKGPPKEVSYMDFLFKNGELYKRFIKAREKSDQKIIEQKRALEDRKKHIEKELWAKAQEALHHFYISRKNEND